MPPVTIMPRAALTDAAFLQLHQTHIGGSAIAAICGVHPFKSRLAVWLEMTGREGAVFAPTRRMQLGLRLEAPLMQEFQRRTGLVVRPATTIYAAAHERRFIATPDGAYGSPSRLGTEGIYEGKVSTRLAEWDAGPVPEAYCQVQWYMGILELAEATLCCLPNTHENLEHILSGQWDDVPLYTYTVERDDVLIATLFDEAAAFLDLVARDTPPIDDTTPRRDLQRLYPTDTGGTQEGGGALANLVAQHASAALQLKAAEAAKETVETQIMALLGEYSYGTVWGERVVSWKAHSREHLDIKRLKLDHPELAGRYTTTQTVRPLRVMSQKG